MGAETKEQKNYSLKKKKKDQFSLPDQSNRSGKCQHQAKETVGDDARGGENTRRSSFSSSYPSGQVACIKPPLFRSPKLSEAAVFISKGLLSSTRTKRTRDRTALELQKTEEPLNRAGSCVCSTTSTIRGRHKNHHPASETIKKKV